MVLWKEIEWLGLLRCGNKSKMYKKGGNGILCTSKTEQITKLSPKEGGVKGRKKQSIEEYSKKGDMRKYTCLLFVQKIYIKDKSETEEPGHLHGVGSKGVIRRGN